MSDFASSNVGAAAAESQPVPGTPPQVLPMSPNARDVDETDRIRALESKITNV